jgi:hypothetical protein
VTIVSKNIKPDLYLPSHDLGEFEINIETSHTIFEHIPAVSGLYAVDALTEKGYWLHLLGIDCDPDDRDELIRQIVRQRQRWESPRTSTLISVSSKRIEAQVSPAAQSPPVLDQGGNEEADASWASLPAEILARLENGSSPEEEQITAVLFAEVTRFDESQKPRLLGTLYRFIEQYRFSDDDSVMTAVGSAIRKYAMNMPSTEFESYSRLFSPTSTTTLSCEVELELAKAASWRLAKAGNIQRGEYPNLESRLAELASDYLTTRLVLQENYASIVIHAILAVGMLNGQRQEELIDRVSKLRIDWFSDLLARRLLEAARKRHGLADGREDNLSRLEQRLVNAGR